MTLVAASSLLVGDVLVDGTGNGQDNLWLDPRFSAETVGQTSQNNYGGYGSVIPTASIEENQAGNGNAFRFTFSSGQVGGGGYWFIFPAAQVPVVAGEIYSFGQYGYQYEAVTGGVGAVLQFYNSSGGALGGQIPTSYGVGVGPYCSSLAGVVAPAGAVTCTALAALVAPTAACDYEVSCFMFNTGSELNPPADGNAPGWRWNGVPNLSTSQAVDQNVSTVAFIQPATPMEPAGTVRLGIAQPPFKTVSKFVPASQLVAISNR